MSVHLGFDMGIRNLAFCLIKHEGETWEVLAWDNVDLLSEGQSSQTSRRCVACAAPAVWSSSEPTGERLWCKACATGVRRKKTATCKPPFPIVPCALQVKELRALAAEKGWNKKAKKEDLLQRVKQCYLMPWKAPKATSPSLQHILGCMDRWLDTMLPTFAKATLIRLENQPVMKGPTMKSIQIMLFSLLSHRLEREHGWKGRIDFVHAGVKTRGAEATVIEDIVEGEEPTDSQAYQARKKTAETETITVLQTKPESPWLSFFQSRSKKSDLADAFLMAMRKG
jgi:hypothetical protein